MHNDVQGMIHVTCSAYRQANLLSFVSMQDIWRFSNKIYTQ